MKILQVTNGYGGEAVMTEKISNGLSKFFESDILAIKQNTKFDSLDFVSVFDEAIPTYKGIKKFIKISSMYDLLIFHNMFNYSSLFILFLSAISGKKSLCVVHNNIEGIRIGFKYYYLMLRKFVICNSLLFLTNKVVFLTNNQKNKFKKYALRKSKFENMTYVIPNFIEEKFILSHVREKKFGLIYVGRFTKYKGFHDMLCLFDSKVLQGIDVLCIGGKYKGDLKNESIYFISHVSNDEIFYYYDKFSVFILPSYSEVFPISILEAMSRGLVVLCSSVGGLGELVKEGQNGFLFDPGDNVKIQLIISNLISNPSIIKQISQNNIEKSQEYTEEKIIPKYVKIINGICSEK